MVKNESCNESCNFVPSDGFGGDCKACGASRDAHVRGVPKIFNGFDGASVSPARVSPALDLNQFQERSRAAVAYPRCRIILDDNDPVDAPWLLPLLALLHKAGTLAGSYAHIIESDRGVLTRTSSKTIEAEHGDVLGNVARLADAHSKSLGDTACDYLSRLAERIRRVRRVTADRG